MNRRQFGCLIGVLILITGASVTLAGTVSEEAQRSRERPLPHDCAEAEKAADPQAKVNLYTRCLDVEDKFTGPLDSYQRDNMHLHRANALFELRRYAEALVDYDWFISKTYGDHVWALHQRGLTHQAMGQRQLALANFNQALKSNSGAVDVRFDRGRLLAEVGLYQQSIEDLRTAATSSPENAVYANALGWLLATCPDAKIHNGKEAVSFALKAVSIDRNAQYLDTLAAAQARKGDFKQAVETQQAALDLLQKEKAVQETIKEFTTRLSLYTTDMPYTQRRSE